MLLVVASTAVPASPEVPSGGVVMNGAFGGFGFGQAYFGATPSVAPDVLVSAGGSRLHGARGQHAFVILEPPRNEIPPALTGVAREGETLTVSRGVWAGEPRPAFAYQWLRGTEDIPNATGRKHTLTFADVGLAICVRVTATNSLGTAIAYSAPTQPVAAAVPPVALDAQFEQMFADLEELLTLQLV